MKQLMPWRDCGFPQLINNVISQHESVIVLKPVHVSSIMEANVWGMLFYGSQIEADEAVSAKGTMAGIHLYRFTGYVLVFLHHARMMLSTLGYSGPLSVEASLSSIRGIKWLYSPNGLFISRTPPRCSTMM